MFFSAAEAADLGDNILEYSQRADDRAVYPPAHQGQDDECCDDRHIQSQYGGEKLYLCQPTEPCVKASREIEKQKCDE